MAARLLMFQGTASDVGKSTLVTAFCRLARRAGLSVAPFKAQNMSNNAAIALEGGEIGRAQALQARAAGLPPSIYMNPILRKPESDTRSQTIVLGRTIGTIPAEDYYRSVRPGLKSVVLDSLSELRRRHDLVIVEGAGAAAEPDFRPNDILNMGLACETGAPVVLIADVMGGGASAHIVGTSALLSREDADLIQGFLLNKFRGDASLIAEGIRTAEQRTGWHHLGTIPWIPEVEGLAKEDGWSLRAPYSAKSTGPIRIVVPKLSRISNYDDVDALRAEPDVSIEIIPPGRALPLDGDLVLLLGTKSTTAELSFMRQQGWDIDILAHARRGGAVLGICGGFQMLGERISDPDGVDGTDEHAIGLRLLPFDTIMSPTKIQRTVSGTDSLWGERVSGYEIRSGRILARQSLVPMLSLDVGSDGAMSADRRILGCHLHGLFCEDGFRAALLRHFRSDRCADRPFEMGVELTIDRLADSVAGSVDVDAIFGLARQ